MPCVLIMRCGFGVVFTHPEVHVLEVWSPL